MAGTVTGAITAVGQAIALVCGTNPTKDAGSKKLLPRIAQTLDGWRKEDPPTTKQLPVEADVPKLLVERGRTGNTTELDWAIGDLTLTAFYYLLQIREYTIKGTHKDITFFKKNSDSKLRCLPRNALTHLIATTNKATMKLDNQKNGWKGVCIFHKSNGDNYLCPVRAL